MKLAEHLRLISIAMTPAALEKRFQAAIDDYPRWATRKRIRAAVKARGRELCRFTENGSFVPVYDGRSNRVTVCGESYRVGRWGNGAGYRYCWHYADEWMREVLRKFGCRKKQIEAILEWWSNYPHRALRHVPRRSTTP